MAKIYETKDDFQRDMLDQQAGELHLKSEKQASSGMGWLVASSIPLFFERRPRWLDYIATALSVFGLVDLVQSWRTRSRAHDLELERERMGPQHIMLPADTLPPGVSAQLPIIQPAKEDCAPCKHKKMAGAVKPKSLADYAEKLSDPNAVQR
jgi:hypothetical protein